MLLGFVFKLSTQPEPRVLGKSEEWANFFGELPPAESRGNITFQQKSRGILSGYDASLTILASEGKMLKL
jgi:hypothetical protein